MYGPVYVTSARRCLSGYGNSLFSQLELTIQACLELLVVDIVSLVRYSGT